MNYEQKRALWEILTGLGGFLLFLAMVPTVCIVLAGLAGGWANLFAIPLLLGTSGLIIWFLITLASFACFYFRRKYRPH